jgi:hypothetical protein
LPSMPSVREPRLSPSFPVLLSFSTIFYTGCFRLTGWQSKDRTNLCGDYFWGGGSLPSYFSGVNYSSTLHFTFRSLFASLPIVKLAITG